MLPSECRIGRVVNEKTFHVTKWHGSLRRLSTVLALVIFAHLLLDNFSSLSLGKHPDKVRSSSYQRRSHFVCVDLWTSRHLLFGHIYPPLSTVLSLFKFASSRRSVSVSIANTIHSARTGQGVRNPSHVKRILARFPSGRMEKVTVHTPLGNLAILLADVRDAQKRRNQERTRRSIRESYSHPISILFQFDHLLGIWRRCSCL
mmetsp:Transcript_4375/g.8046  ORF Transcript_4375/g.8046 Transcript_4375/m.8046 type:complete len:203 (-) Transcript_4375:1279-1887(-)